MQFPCTEVLECAAFGDGYFVFSLPIVFVEIKMNGKFFKHLDPIKMG